jgi:DNA-binding MarR family transcriptional regulator
MPARKPQPPDQLDAMIAQWQRELPDLDVSPFAVFGRLHRSFLRYAALIGEVFEQHGINMASFDVLAALRRSGPPYRRTAGDLAYTGLVTTGGLTLRLDRLEKAGLITRERDTDDRRVVYAQITAVGLELTDRVAKEHFANEERMLSGLNQTERRHLAALLAKLDTSLQAAQS